MNVFKFPFALFAFLGFVAVVPGWMYFVSAYSPGLTMEGQLLAGLVLPATAALFLASWLQPRAG